MKAGSDRPGLAGTILRLLTDAGLIVTLGHSELAD
jgi:hypothetical protein